MKDYKMTSGYLYYFDNNGNVFVTHKEVDDKFIPFNTPIQVVDIIEEIELITGESNEK